ncbi:MAG: DVUA0089 family protein [Fimbriimonadales bacterium]
MQLRTLWAFTTACALFAGAWAQATLYSTSFEDPPFTAGGGVAGIDGWENGSGSGVEHLVTNELFRSGSQSVKWDNISNTSFYSIRRSFVWSQTDPDRLVVSVHVWVDSGTQANRVYGLYLTSSDTGTLGSTILGITIGGDGTVRAGTTWGATYGSSGVIGQAAPGTYTNRWLLMELTICRTNGQATAKINGFSDGSELQANFVATGTPRNLNLGSDYVTSTDRAGIGFFDDLTVAVDSSGCSPFEGWDEQRDGGGDAGDLPETAQSTGSGSLNAIRGELETNDVDMYAIYIADASTFSASTVGSASFDTQLWLFDADGKGVVFNDDAVNTSVTQSTIDNSTFCIPAPGLYYLAISRYNRDAIGCGEDLIWNNSPFREVRCPDGPESTSRVNGWTGTTSAAGTYVIQLTGAEGATAGNPDDCPPPGLEVWREQEDGGGDAGDLPATAQLVNRADSNPCTDPVTRIRGDMEADGVDMYVICITDPSSFVATTVGGTSWDTQLWLFRCDGTGVVANDDSSGLQSRLDNTPGCITEAGTYLLAITRFNRDAVDANGNLLWSSSALSCADNTNPIAGWTGSTVAQGAYSILITGGYFVSPNGCEGGGSCEGDVNGDGVVDDADLLEVLFNFGCFGFCGPSDVNRDGTVDDADLLVVLFNFGCGA